MDAPKRLQCPLLDTAVCYGEKCAWWNHVDKECSVATLGVLARHLIKKAEG